MSNKRFFAVPAVGFCGAAMSVRGAYSFSAQKRADCKKEVKYCQRVSHGLSGAGVETEPVLQHIVHACWAFV